MNREPLVSYHRIITRRHVSMTERIVLAIDRNPILCGALSLAVFFAILFLVPETPVMQ